MINETMLQQAELPRLDADGHDEDAHLPAGHRQRNIYI